MNEFEPYLMQTRSCLDAGLYYPALAMALALPDICARLDGRPGTHSERYKSWLTEMKTFIAVEPEWIWRVRCAFLHDANPVLGQGKPQGRIDLVEQPGPLHRTHMEPGLGEFGTITIEVQDLVGSLLEAASRWAKRPDNDLLIREKAKSRELVIIRRREHK